LETSLGEAKRLDQVHPLVEVNANTIKKHEPDITKTILQTLGLKKMTSAYSWLRMLCVGHLEWLHLLRVFQKFMDGTVRGDKVVLYSVDS